ncbi:unnamed protein product [Parnassius apollo]|uniref:(apollo) hypothetical protein n=1 Tax=Parnassius apollo TaxID=110799 RepID=A0A8S3X6E5_PARAO|nr:unnamed protein product [Parnassius apollo]
MYGSCHECKRKKLNYDKTKFKGKVYFSEWTRKEDKYIKDGKHIKSIKNVKETKEVEIEYLIKDFEIELILLKKHKISKIFQKSFQETLQDYKVLCTCTNCSLPNTPQQIIPSTRTLSCFCERGFCKCLEPKIYHPVPLVSTTTADASVDNDTAMVIPSSPTDSADASGACGDNNIVNTLSSSMPSDDDVPPNRIKSRCSGATVTTASKALAEINCTDLAKDAGKRGAVYDMVYGSVDASNEENQPTTSGNNKMLPSNGDFLLVSVHAGKNKTYTYASLAQSDLEDDGEIKVIFLRAYKGATKFKLDENDIAFVEFNDIIKILPTPKQIIKNG